MDKVGISREFSFYTDYKDNYNPQDSCKNIDRTPMGPYSINGDDDLELKISNTDRTDGQVWIAFPQSNPVLYPNCTIIETNDSIWEGQEVIASVPSAGEGAKYEWNITPRGIIKSKKPYKNQIVWKAINPGNVTVKVKVSNSNSNCSGEVEKTISERKTINVNDDENLNEIISKSENKILLLENGSYDDSIVINVKNIDIKSRNKLGAKLHTRGSDYGIYIDETYGVSIEAINLEDCKAGIIIHNSRDCNISGNNISFKNKAGIYIDNSSNNTIINNIIKPERGFLGFGVRLDNISFNNTIRNNNITSESCIFAFALKQIGYKNIIIDEFNGKIHDLINKRVSKN